MRRIKWKNIMGLVVLLAAVFIIVTAMTLFSTLFYGDCIEKNNVRVCFDVQEKVIGKNEVSSIILDISNTGDAQKGAKVKMSVSPNLNNETAATQVIEGMAAGDTIKREFKVSSKNELGEFKVGFDIDSDGISDKDLLITVE